MDIAKRGAAIVTLGLDNPPKRRAHPPPCRALRPLSLSGGP